jgi:hypothetical protein
LHFGEFLVPSAFPQLMDIAKAMTYSEESQDV